LIEEHEVSIWNTVPALMEIMVSHLELEEQMLPDSLRVVFMSGDWLPLNLASRIRALSSRPYGKTRDCLRIISMGGATEASIWSNIYEIGPPGFEVPPGWASVPYGVPLRNQTMYILDANLDHCETWVPGVIHIGGVGVANGYHNDPERSAYQFFHHPRTNEPLFRTGDLGRIRPLPGGGGLLEILGREDNQVKVNGFRIELGEIERVIATRAQIRAVSVAVHNNVISAYIVTHEEMDSGMLLEPKALISQARKDCRAALTDYMVPRHFLMIKAIPLSANGKVDRNRLPKPDEVTKGAATTQGESAGGGAQAAAKIGPSSPQETTVRQAMAFVLSIEEEHICCKTDSFYTLGGNSLSSLQLIFQIHTRIGVRISIPELFNAPSVCGIVETSTRRSSVDGSERRRSSDAHRIQLLSLNSGTRSAIRAVVLVNPAGASGLCYLELAKALGSDTPVFVLDDGVVSTGIPLSFDSIDSVVEACIDILSARLKLYLSATGIADKCEIVMAGWSYGGVVALEISRRLAMIGVSTRTIPPLSGVCMFDSPLEARKAASKKETQVLNEHSRSHFIACTNLLSKYHSMVVAKGSIREKEAQLNCPVVHVLPEEEDRDPTSQFLQRFTAGVASDISGPGDHWTMLYGQNAAFAASVLQKLLQKS